MGVRISPSAPFSIFRRNLLRLRLFYWAYLSFFSPRCLVEHSIQRIKHISKPSIFSLFILLPCIVFFKYGKFIMKHLVSSSSDKSSTDNFVTFTTGPQDHLTICSLVLSAVRIKHKFETDHKSILVAEHDMEKAQREMAHYVSENMYWPPKKKTVPKQSEASITSPTFLTMSWFVIFFLITGPWTDGNTWFMIGAIDSSAIFKLGEWWRLCTALTLHADDMHLVGNMVIGGFMVHLLCNHVGYGIAWVLLFLSGISGNFLNIWLRSSVHHSVGFSTAVFSAIGIFCGIQFYTNRVFGLKQLLLPLGAGAALLALLGSQGEKTDIGAHFFGFLCGMLVGFLFEKTTKVTKLRDKHRSQFFYFSLTVLFICFCWFLAWTGSNVDLISK